jgi:CheY-like chemotaxis protein
MSRFNILLAEDNLGDVLLVQQALAAHNISNELYVVRDGGEALQFVGQMGKPGYAPCPDLLLLDLNLPKVDGPAILAEFRKHPECIQTPVVVISSSDASNDRDRMNALGVTHYFRKPSDLEAYLQLGSVVKALLSNGTDSLTVAVRKEVAEPRP